MGARGATAAGAAADAVLLRDSLAARARPWGGQGFIVVCLVPGSLARAAPY